MLFQQIRTWKVNTRTSPIDSFGGCLVSGFSLQPQYLEDVKRSDNRKYLMCSFSYSLPVSSSTTCLLSHKPDATTFDILLWKLFCSAISKDLKIDCEQLSKKISLVCWGVWRQARECDEGVKKHALCCQESSKNQSARTTIFFTTNKNTIFVWAKNLYSDGYAWTRQLLLGQNSVHEQLRFDVVPSWLCVLIQWNCEKNKNWTHISTWHHFKKKDPFNKQTSWLT